MWRGEVRPGETIRIGHLAETYDGKPVRSRRRKITAVTHACADRPSRHATMGGPCESSSATPAVSSTSPAR